MKLPELRARILRYGLGIIAGIFLTLTAASTLVVWNSYRHQIESNNELLLNEIGHSIEEYLNQPQKQIELLSILYPHAHQHEIQELLNSFRSMDDRFQRIQVQDSLGQILWTSPANISLIGLDMSQQAFFKLPAQTRTPYWSPVFISPIDELATVAFSVPFPQGVLTAYLSMENLAEFQLPKEVSGTIQLYVTDHTGTFLLHPEIHRVKERETFPLFPALKKIQTPGRVLHATLAQGKQAMNCSGKILPKYNWGIFLIQPQGTLTRPIYKLVATLAILMILFSVLATLFGLYAFRQVYNPFLALVQQMNQLGTEGACIQHMDTPLYKEYAEITTQFNQMVDRVHERQNALSMKNKELESMLYIATHDLRTPLVNISGFSQEIEVMLQDLEQNLSNATVRQNLIRIEIPTALQFVTNSAKRMDQLLQGILRIARLSRAEMQPQSVDLNDVFHRIRDNLDFTLRQKNASFVVDPLPAVWGDPSELHQLFSNLVENALKYTSEGRSPEIHVQASEDNQFCFVRIRDNGKGISATDQKKIFNIFFRVGDSPGIPGEGLGLTIVQRIVERHQGEITLYSDLGVGSEFTIKLPKIK